jgi:hypothetical protein
MTTRIPGDNRQLFPLVKKQKPSIISRRDFLKGAAGLGAVPLLAGCGVMNKSIFNENISIRRENEKTGTRDWMLTNTRVDPKNQVVCPWIEGYCSRTSVRSGEKISFFVSTDPVSEFTLDIYRMGYYGGTGGRQVMSLGPFKGATQAYPPVGENRVRDCQWQPCAEITIPGDWISGVYLGKLTAERESLQSYVIFIVHDDRRADFIFQCSDPTWQAYNRWPGRFSLYDNGKSNWYWGPNVDVCFNRPYGKSLLILANKGSIDAPLTTGSGEWFLWEFPLAYWMEQHGYDITYISSLDAHSDTNNLLRAKGLLSVGHDEYYSIEMFNHMKSAIDSGVSTAFLSANTSFGRILFSPDSGGQPNRSFGRVGVFGPPGGTREFGVIESMPHDRPYANELVGAQSTGPVTGGADWICAQPHHWLFEGTGMKKGDGIPGLVGPEWNGDPAPIPGLEILATGRTHDPLGRLNGGVYTSTIYPGPKGNLVFNASTFWWADGLAEPPGYVRQSRYPGLNGPYARCQRITQNLLERMRSAT